MTPRPPRVRLAPSPTGLFHLGTARTALFNWLIARQHPEGVYIVRVEDTDESRNREEWVEVIFSSLAWLGMPSDVTPERQSANRPFHEAARDALVASGHLYYCDCRAEDVAARKGDDKTPGYDGYCRERGLAKSEHTALRFAVPHEESIVVHDLVRGDVTFDLAHLEDFVVAKSDGSVLYALANVVDDRRDRITHVIRGEEHLANAPKQLLMWRALSMTTEPVDEPVFAHLPLIVNDQRKKLSKRRDAVSTEMYRAQGYLSSAFVNYLGLLGWSPRGDEEKADLATMIEQFRLEDVAKSPAAFDVKKLTHLNGQYIRELSPEAFIEACRPWVAPWTCDWRPEDVTPPWGEREYDQALFDEVATLVHERVATLGEVPGMVAFFFVEPTLDEEALAKSASGQAAALLDAVIAGISEVHWDAASLHALVESSGDALGLKLRHSQAPVRLAVTGTSVGPPLFESMVILGRDVVTRRLVEARGVLA